VEEDLSRLLGRANQHLVDGDVARARHDVLDRVGDIRGLEALDPGEDLLDPLPDLRAVVLESSVSTAPGSTSETRTCRPASSWRSDTLNAPTPCLVAL
jgi:hypothetical protein